MIGPLLRALITMYGPSMAKTLFVAIKKTLDKAGHNPAKDFQDLLTPTKLKPMTSQEARLVLGINKVTPNDINVQFEKLYKMNDPTKGGSFYLQCKLLGAKETLLNSKK